MGNKNIKSISSFSDWEKVQTQGDIQIYKHKKSNQLAEKRSITLDPHYELQNQLKIYHMRQNNNDSLVKAYGAEEPSKKNHSEGICSGHKKLEVLTQKIPYRLSDLPQLTFPQTMLFLRESLRSYFRVFKSYGPIHITKKMIGINEFGQVRCWVNQNWALNHPNNDLPTLQSTKLQSFSSRSTQISGGSEAYDARYRDETQMVHNIVAVIEQKCQEGKFPEAFSEQVSQHSGSFRRLSTYVQDFIRVNELFIPPKINYETVFVSKYETRLAEQHQQSGQSQQQQMISSQGHYAGQVTERQKNEKIMAMTTIDSQNNKGWGMSNRYQQQGYSGHLGYEYGVSQQAPPQQVSQNGYTLTNTTTKTYGNNTAIGKPTAPSYLPTYQPTYPSSYSTTFQAQPPILSTTNTNLTPWQKTQSIYKLPDAQSSYTTSYQYSTTNPSSVNGGGNANSYNFGVNSLLTSGREVKPVSSGMYSNGLGGGYGNYSSSGMGYGNMTITSLDNKLGQNNNNNNSTRFAIGDSDNPSSPYQNLSLYTTTNPQNQRKFQYQPKASEQMDSSLNNNNTKLSFQQYKRNFNQSAGTTTGLNSYEYSSTNYNKGNTYEPLISDSANKAGSTFSFDGFNSYGGGGKFESYSTKGYSNNLDSYNNAMTEANADGLDYSNPVLKPLLKMKQEYEVHLRQQNSPSSSQGFSPRPQVNETFQYA